MTSAIQRHACSLVELIAELESGPRSRSKLLRLALQDAVDGARSAAEAEAAAKLRRGGVPSFELNVPIVDEHGALIYVVDVLWRALRAVLEIDSREHHFSESDWLATLERHNELTRYGLAVTHYAPTIVTKRGSAGWQRSMTGCIGELPNSASRTDADEARLPHPPRAERAIVRRAAASMMRCRGVSMLYPK